MTPRAVLFFGLLCASARAACDAACYALPSTPSSGRAADAAFLQCCACSADATPLLAGLSAADRAALCAPSPPQNASAIGSRVAAAVYALQQMQGMWYLDGGGPEDNATACLAHLFTFMPRRDAMVMFEDLLGRSLDFLAETVRLSLAQWPRLAAFGVPWQTFLDGVLPYAVLNEKRDWDWRWRPRLARLFGGAWAGAASLTDAMHNLSAMIPRGSAEYTNVVVANFSDGSGALQEGPVFTWHSETSPGYLSVQQVAARYGSCTGTGIVMVAAARAIGIPARLAGCSQTDVPNDDHHCERVTAAPAAKRVYALTITPFPPTHPHTRPPAGAEFYDPLAPGPFANSWHTKEGTSRGNEGGPWDAPSGPMAGCLRGVAPGSSLNTMWASSWSSPTFLPTLWEASAAPLWAFVGGENVCGAYCSAWGCGANGTKWSQQECYPGGAR